MWLAIVIKKRDVCSSSCQYCIVTKSWSSHSLSNCGVRMSLLRSVHQLRWVTLSSTPSRVCVCHRWARLCEVLLLRFFPPQDETGMIRPDCAEYCVFLRGTSSSDGFFELTQRLAAFSNNIYVIHSASSNIICIFIQIKRLHTMHVNQCTFFQMSLMHFKLWEFWGSYAQKDRNKSFQIINTCYK